MANHYLHKTSPCRGDCSKTEAECSFAHSIHSWNPKHPKMMCSNGINCWYKETSCCRIHDGSLADKIRYARFHGIKFHIHYEPRVNVPAPASTPAPVPQKEPDLREDTIYLLQVEKATIQSELELLNIMKKKLEVRILLFQMKASDFWEAGSAEMEF
jgi:hypothetical protein